MEIPEVTEISRLALNPGDRLIVRTAGPLTYEQGDYLQRKIRAVLQLPADFPLAVIPGDMNVQVVAGEA